jgi:transketolase
MRTAFFASLLEAARYDHSIMLMVGDLGFGVVERFATEFPAQFINVGVAEQNLAGIAAGLALSGKTVVTYSIANFPTLRCLEQIRNDICYHGLNVKVVSVGGGFAYGSLGMSHHATEDLAIMRALPGMTVVAPGDPGEAAAATRSLLATPGPCYLRLGRAGERRIGDAEAHFQLGRATMIREGNDVTIISTGALLETAVTVATELRSLRISTRVLSMHTLKPIDADAIRLAAIETRAIFAIEEHSVIGGLGSAVAEVLAELDIRPAIFRRIGLPSEFSKVNGSQEYLRHAHGLSPARIVRTITSITSRTVTLEGC